MNKQGTGGHPLNRQSVIPLYYQLAEDLQRQIDGGVWQAHVLIPSEADLGQSYGVARSVVRQALDELERGGAIYRIKGRGGFVSERKLMAYLMQDVRGFAANMADQGFTLDSQILSKGYLPAPARVAEALHLPDGAAVLAVERLRSVQGDALFLGTTYIPEGLARRMVDEDFESQSINALLIRCTGLQPTTGVRVIETVAASRREAEQLQVSVGTPLFRLFAVTYGQDGTPMECSQVWLRGDRLAFRVELGCPPAPTPEREAQA